MIFLRAYVYMCLYTVAARAASPRWPRLHLQHGLFAIPGWQVRGGLQEVHLCHASVGICAGYLSMSFLHCGCYALHCIFISLLGVKSCGFHETDEQTVCVPLALSYNIALCHYSLKMYPQALKHIEDIKNRGIKEHPGQNSCVQCVCLFFFSNWLMVITCVSFLRARTERGDDFRGSRLPQCGQHTGAAADSSHRSLEP